VLPSLDIIRRVFEDVHSTINTWCQPSRMGAAVTVLRNMAIASWYQVGGLTGCATACTGTVPLPLVPVLYQYCTRWGALLAVPLLVLVLCDCH
jgi:hypothetical protein